MSETDNKTDKPEIDLNRRQVLGCMCALGFSLPGMNDASAQDAALMLPPQVNDLLAYAFGDKAGQPINASDLELESKQVFAFALDPATGMMRNGTRMNQVLLIRLDPATLAPETAARSANGVVGYSGVCSHTGCDVTDWNSEFKRFQCPCHESQFDPSNSARVVGGPAPWQLAALPLKEVDSQLAVAGAFEGRLGFQQPGLSPFGI